MKITRLNNLKEILKHLKRNWHGTRIRFKFRDWFSLRLIIGDDFRSRAHAAFDPLWQSGEMSRNAAYRWLTNELGITRDECHMSKLGKKMCERVIELCEKKQSEVGER